MKKNLFTPTKDLMKIDRKLFSFLLAIIFFQTNAFAQSANILVNPTSSTISVGQSFTVNVRVDMQSGTCNGTEIHLNFNTSFLTVTNITRPSSGTFTSETISLPAAPYTSFNSSGHIEYAAGIPVGSTSSDFDILAITFNTLQAGTTSLTFTNSPGHRTRAIIGATVITSPGSLFNGTVNISSTLPVGLLNFSATPQGKKVMLSWTTSSETSNRGFDVQRSNDGVNWTTIGFVAGAGNSSFVRNYTYGDDNLETRRYYYRLKQIDLDEHSKYSAIVSAVIGGKGEYALGQNYPNPFRNETTIQYTLPQAGQVNLSLFDISGRAVKVLVNGAKEAGTYAISFNTGSLTRGVYYYRIQVGNFTDVKKLTIQ